MLAFALPRQVLFDGVIQGLTFGVVAMGLILIYRTSRVLNFAIVESGALAAALLARLVINWGVAYWAAFALCILAGGVLGAVAELAVVRRLFRAPRVILFVATIGLAQLFLFVQGVLPGLRSYRAFPTPWSQTFHVWGVAVRSEHLLVMIFVPVVAVGLTVFFHRTKYGTAVRAAAANPDAARVCGISVKRMSTIVWALGGLLGALSTVLTAPFTSANASDTLAFGPAVLLPAIVAALIGRMRSMPWAVAGGIAIGAGQAVLYYNYPTRPGLLDAALFVAVLLLLLLFAGRTYRATDHEANWSVSPRVRPVPPRLQTFWVMRELPRLGTVLALMAAIAFPLVVTGASHQFLFSRVFVYALVALSLTVLTGWTGQLSLGQFAIVGFSAMVAAWLSREGVPFLAALVAVTALGTVSALVIGVPALRLRGLFLAVTTLAFAVAAPAWLFSTHALLPNGVDVTVPRARILGISLESERSYYYLCLLALVVAIGFVARLRKSGVGRGFVAVRDNESSVESFAQSAARLKVTAFVIAGGLAGLAGGLLASLITDFGPQRFGPTESLQVVAVAVIGGIASVPGTVLGALWVVGIPALFPNSANASLLVSGAGLLVLLLYLPGGLAQILYAVRDSTLAWVASRLPVAGRAPQRPAAVPRAAETGRAADHERPAPTLRVEALTVRFSRRVVVNAVDMHVAAGEAVGLIGANGAGKSTLMNAIGGYLPSEGSVVLGDHDISHLSPSRRARMGLGRTFQAAMLFADLTVRETVLVAMEAAHHVGPAAIGLGLPSARRAERAKRAQADEVLSYLGLGFYADRFINELSTGTRRIVELACLLAMAPRVLCLDEPTAGIAQRESEAFAPLVTAVRRELDASLLIIEHDMPLVMAVSDRIYCLEAGRMICEGPPDTVRNDPAVIASYLGTDQAAIARSGAAPATPVKG